MAAASIIPPIRDDKRPVETVSQAGKYVTFRVARQDFAMKVGFVRGILPVHQMAANRAHEWICGFSSMGGRDFPVVDLGAKLGIEPGSHGREPFIIVVSTGERLVAFIADRVSEILDLRVWDFRNGVLRIRGRARRVLEPSQIMQEADWSALTLTHPSAP